VQGEGRGTGLKNGRKGNKVNGVGNGKYGIGRIGPKIVGWIRLCSELAS